MIRRRFLSLVALGSTTPVASGCLSSDTDDDPVADSSENATEGRSNTDSSDPETDGHEYAWYYVDDVVLRRRRGLEGDGRDGELLECFPSDDR